MLHTKETTTPAIQYILTGVDAAKVQTVGCQYYITIPAAAMRVLLANLQPSRFTVLDVSKKGNLSTVAVV